jgi:hypothetical protein
MERRKLGNWALPRSGRPAFSTVVSESLRGSCILVELYIARCSANTTLSMDLASDMRLGGPTSLLTGTSAFHKAHPRARAHTASSIAIAFRNASRLAPLNKVHAIVRSHAGSPTPLHPKSITAASRPSRTSRLDGATSPCIQTPGNSHRDARAASHTATAVTVSSLPLSAETASLTSVS